MHMSATKPAQLRIRIEDEDAEMLEELSGRILSPPAVAAMLLAAAIEAIRENGGRITLPPKFQVSASGDTTHTLNEKFKVRK